ncbi:MAG: hypothetical protein ACP5NP_17090 [Acetobacteraceae bacterium]
MDPDPPLARLLAPLASLPGIGVATARLLARATGGDRVLDLLFHRPETYLDHRARPTIAAARAGQIATLAVEVLHHKKPVNDRQPWRVIVSDGTDTGTAELVFCRCRREGQMPPGAKLLVSGKLERFGERLTLPHPDHVVPADKPEALPWIEPVWPLTAGLWPRQVRRAMTAALALLPEFPGWHDAPLLRREAWPAFTEALRALQAPAEIPDERPRASKQRNAGLSPAVT